MNLKRLIAALSISGCALGATAGWLALRPPAVDLPNQAAAGPGSHSAPTVKSSAFTARNTAETKSNFVWATVETNDYKAFVTNLRAIKCPEATVRDIIIAEMDRYFADRELPFKTPPEPASAVGSARVPESAQQKRARLKQDYERRKQLREVELEKAAILKQLLDYDLPLEPLRGWRTRNYERFESAINALPAEKRERVRAIQEAYWELSDALNDQRADKLAGAKNAEYIQHYKENNDKRLAALGGILTPDELENYEMRCSSVAGKLARNLSDFKPTEEEFREIWRGRHEIEEPYGGTMTASAADGNKPDPKKEEELAAKLRASMGDERYNSYLKAQDSNYQSLSRLRERFGLNQDAIDQAYTLMRQNPTILDNPGKRVEIVDGKQVQTPQPEPPREALAKLKSILGENAYLIATANSPWASLPEP